MVSGTSFLVAAKHFGDEMNEAMGEINTIHTLLAKRFVYEDSLCVLR